MFHFIKYLLFVVFLFAFLNFFRSNMDVMVAFKFDIPLVGAWATEPVSANFLALAVFCAGVLFASLVGAFRMGDIRREKKQLKQMREEIAYTPTTPKSPDSLPPLAE